MIAIYVAYYLVIGKLASSPVEGRASYLYINL